MLATLADKVSITPLMQGRCDVRLQDGPSTPNIEVQASKHRGNEAAVYLERVVNEYASEGWEFYRIDSIGVSVKAGCFDALSGKKIVSQEVA